VRALVVSLLVVGALAVSAVHAASPPPLQSSTDLAALGLYRFADGSYAAIVKPGEGGAGIRVVDYSTGALRQLAQESSNTFVAGPGVSVLKPVSMRIRLLTGTRGAVVGLRLDGQPARRVPLVARNVLFHDHAVLLACRLLLPVGKGPFPAVEIVPGSPATLRDGYDLWAMFYASQGYAVLSCDKRGVGQSTGTYVHDATLANLHNLAADTIAGVTWLRHQPEIDRTRIGLTGGSQAGWVIVLAAAESGRIRFATIQSGPAMSVGRQLAYAGRTKQGALDPPPTDAQIQARLANVPESGYDPKPDIAKLKIPVLWQLGSVDKRMYTPETVADLTAINASGTHDFTVKVYPGGAHSLRLTAHGLISEEKTSPGFVPGLFADLAAWLSAHVTR
jgi:dienelactone hydrolase